MAVDAGVTSLTPAASKCVVNLPESRPDGTSSSPSSSESEKRETMASLSLLRSDARSGAGIQEHEETRNKADSEPLL